LNDKLLELGSVEHVDPLDPLDVIVRIDELRQLKRGWLDGKGEAIDAQQLDWVVEAFSQRGRSRIESENCRRLKTCPRLHLLSQMIFV